MKPEVQLETERTSVAAPPAAWNGAGAKPIHASCARPKPTTSTSLPQRAFGLLRGTTPHRLSLSSGNRGVGPRSPGTRSARARGRTHPGAGPTGGPAQLREPPSPTRERATALECPRSPAHRARRPCFLFEHVLRCFGSELDQPAVDAANGLYISQSSFTA